MKNSTRARRLGLVALVSVLAAAGCNGQRLSSRWRDRDVLVDGDPTEWYNASTYLESQKVSVGVMNDDARLYVLLTSADRSVQRQVLARGFTVWFDPKGGEHKDLGIKFPLGMRERFGRRGDGEGRRGQQSGGNDDGDEGGRRGRNGPGPMGRDLPDMETLIANLKQGDPPLEILLGDEARRSTLAQETDIRVAVGSVNGALVYELSVPLGKGPDAVDAAPGNVISVKLETAAVNRERPQRAPDADGGFGGETGRSGGPMGGPPGGGMGMQGPSGSGPEPIDVWAKVVLASRP